ncbi:MAG: 5' nucleotidase, NT5C type [Desertimonas sp.]
MRLGIDMDGVMCDFNAGWMRLHAAEFGSDLRPEMVTQWNGLHTLAGFGNMGAFWSWAKGRDDRPSIFRHLEPYPDALATMTALAGAGHDIVVLTAKPDWAIPDTLRWLADHGVPTREIHIRYDKFAVDCDLYLDDAPNVLDELVAHRGDRLICRMVQRWNRPVDGVVDVEGWGDVEEVVTGRSSS